MNLLEKYGPWVAITGASEGTGAAFARKLACEGFNCILIARRNGPLQELAAEIKKLGVECITAAIDLASLEATDRIVAALGNREVGLLITNAGADTNGSLFLDNEIGNWDQLVNVNVVTTMRNCHYFGRLMRDRGRGGIILVGSGACYGGLNGISVYSGVKAFDLCFGEGLWAELRHQGVDVLNLILGRTDTPAHRRLMERNGQPIPPGMANPEDVAVIGLARLPHGPTYNWGQEEHVAGYAPNSPADRRTRILAIEEMSKAYSGKK
jgi:short-subunit dehydrogenase